MAIDSQEIVAVVNGGSRTDWGRRVEEREREREKMKERKKEMKRKGKERKGKEKEKIRG